MNQENAKNLSELNAHVAHTTIKNLFGAQAPTDATCLYMRKCSQPCSKSTANVTYQIDRLCDPERAADWLQRLVAAARKYGIKVGAPAASIGPLVSDLGVVLSAPGDCRGCGFSVNLRFDVNAGHHVVNADTPAYYAIVRSCDMDQLASMGPESYLNDLVFSVFEHLASQPGASAARIKTKSDEIRMAGCYLELESTYGIDMVGHFHGL